MSDLDPREIEQQDRDCAQAEMIERMIQQEEELRSLRRLVHSLDAEATWMHNQLYRSHHSTD